MKNKIFVPLLTFLYLYGDHNLVDIKKINPTIETYMIFATPHNFTGQIVYSKNLCYVHKDVAERLNAIQEELKQLDLGLLIIDAYRTPNAQQTFWDLIHDERYVSNPAKGGGRHTRGTAVDVTLIRLSKKEELHMPIQIADLKDSSYFSEKVGHAYMNLPAEVIMNRMLLKDIMIRHGFTPMPTEWWHYDIINWQDYPVLNINFEELE